MKRLHRTGWLVALIVVAFVVRYWGAGNLDIVGDEATYAFRSIGYVDYLGTDAQTQPIEWYKDQEVLPWWTQFSFHDAPPLVFIVQHAFFRLFGDSIWVARLPAALLGSLAKLLIFWIARRLFNERLAWWTAGGWVISGTMTWIFRTVLLEPHLIFFILLNIAAFLKFCEKPSWWPGFGITLGFVGLTKYTGVFLVPIYFCYLALLYRPLFL